MENERLVLIIQSNINELNNMKQTLIGILGFSFTFISYKINRIYVNVENLNENPILYMKLMY